MLRASLTFAFLIASLFCWNAPARGAEFVDFRVETQLYLVGEEKPINEINTIFRSGFVYDFITDPSKQRDPETTIFDALKGRFVVIDPQRHVWTQVSTEAVKTFSGKIKIAAAGNKDPILNFMATPQFNETTEGSTMVFKSAKGNWMEYRVRAAPAKSSRVVEQYNECSQWHAQLNVMLNPNTLPPFPRMEINKVLAERQLLPTEVQVTIDPKQPGLRQISLRATHRFQWTLLEPERQRIEEAGRQLAAFREVTLEDYNRRGEEETAGKPAAAKRK